MPPADARPADVREARPGDEAELARLSTQLGYPMTPDEAASQLGSLRLNRDHALFVAVADGRLAGWLQVSLPRIFETPASAEIAGLVVDEDRRGAGIGPLLLAAADSWAREHGCRAIRVRSNVVRERAHRFYEREGYGRIKTQQVFEKPL